MTETTPRVLAVPGAMNIRDLGGYRTTAGHITRWRSLLRGDSPHLIMPEGAEALRAAGLSSVVDLRSPDEAAAEPNPLAALATVSYAARPLFDDLAPTLQGVVARASGDLLLDLYQEALDGRSGAVADALTAIAKAPPGAVLFHCTAGKDRTGIIAALLLGAAGVDRADIVADYALTGPRIAPLVERLLARTRDNGGDPVAHARFLRCDADTMAATLNHIDRRHGSVPGYLADIGMDRAGIDALRGRLLDA